MAGILEHELMGNIKNYFMSHSEQVFALLILVSVAAINYLITYKLVFLNFFFIFIVILLGAYYLEAHKALLGGVLITLLVIIYVYYFPSSFMAALTERDLWMNILAWSGFLILTGTVSGTVDQPSQDGGAAAQETEKRSGSGKRQA